jgi:hypothetical protein
MSTQMFPKSSKIMWLISVLFIIMLSISACGWGMTADVAPAEEEAPSVRREEAKGEEGYATDAVGESAPAMSPGEMPVTEGVEIAAEKEGAIVAPPATPLPLPTATIVSDHDMADAVAAEEMVETEKSVRQAEPLRAGEVDDNALWDDYLLYRRNYSGPRVHDRDVTERYIIEVVDGQGIPVLDATVRVLAVDGQMREEIYSAQTYANGQALFHPLALDVDMPMAQVDKFAVEVQKDNLFENFTLTRFNAQSSSSFSEKWTVTLDTRQQFDSINLDVLFLIDATGSMADEIAQIQSTVFDVSAQIDALPGQPDVRYGMVTYRDRGDSFVSNVYEFTPDVRDFSKNLSTVWADGGGDYPESLNEGLHNAVNRVEWRRDDTVKLIFLVADAPPHLDYEQDYDYAVEMENAARHGIKIFPIASSGLDDQGEYIFRQLAQVTMGRFVFLTYEGPTNGGAPGDVTTHHVDEDDYSVENLDDLLVRMVEEELAYQNPQLVQVQ